MEQNGALWLELWLNAYLDFNKCLHGWNEIGLHSLPRYILLSIDAIQFIPRKERECICIYKRQSMSMFPILNRWTLKWILFSRHQTINVCSVNAVLCKAFDCFAISIRPSLQLHKIPEWHRVEHRVAAIARNYQLLHQTIELRFMIFVG